MTRDGKFYCDVRITPRWHPKAPPPPRAKGIRITHEYPGRGQGCARQSLRNLGPVLGQAPVPQASLAGPGWAWLLQGLQEPWQGSQGVVVAGSQVVGPYLKL